MVLYITIIVVVARAADNILLIKMGRRLMLSESRLVFGWNKKISKNIYYFLLASSLLEAADKIANTASIYGAFLKNIKQSAAKDIVFRSSL
jgi:hypothetical protein